jgi:peptidoglycan L-alanyl-D-glutamate endopeptidase CwlK
MPTFGKNSKKHLATLDPELQVVLEEAILHYDFSVVCGFRNMEDQNTAYNEERSNLRWPESNHNKHPSTAVDIIPYPTGYDNIPEFFVMASHIYAAAIKHGVRLKWGGHWTNLKDYPHFELIL